MTRLLSQDAFSSNLFVVHNAPRSVAFDIESAIVFIEPFGSLDAILLASRCASYDAEPESVLASSSTDFQPCSALRGAFHMTSSPNLCSQKLFNVPSTDLHTPRSASLDIKPASMPVESFRKHPAPSRSRGTSEIAIKSHKNLPCLKRPWSPVSGLEELSDNPLASSPLRRARRSLSARPNVPPGLRFSHECFNAPKSLSTPCGSTFDPASFVCVASPSGLRRTN